jgi:hypothetical protein
MNIVKGLMHSYGALGVRRALGGGFHLRHSPGLTRDLLTSEVADARA